LRDVVRQGGDDYAGQASHGERVARIPRRRFGRVTYRVPRSDFGRVTYRVPRSRPRAPPGDRALTDAVSIAGVDCNTPSRVNPQEAAQRGGPK
jgi:hypothetical protein